MPGALGQAVAFAVQSAELTQRSTEHDPDLPEPSSPPVARYLGGATTAAEAAEHAEWQAERRVVARDLPMTHFIPEVPDQVEIPLTEPREPELQTRERALSHPKWDSSPSPTRFVEPATCFAATPTGLRVLFLAAIHSSALFFFDLC